MAIDMLIRKKWDKFSLDINFKSQSKRIGILGASGCGKSMTLKSIAGIETPDSGHIKIDGNILFDKETKTNLKTQKRKVGYLFQNYASEFQPLPSDFSEAGKPLQGSYNSR